MAVNDGLATMEVMDEELFKPNHPPYSKLELMREAPQ